MTLDHLLAPLTIGTAQLPCRIVSTSHQTTLVEDHLPTQDFVAYQQARAQGGAGLIIMEAVAVAPSGLLTAHTLAGYLDPIVAGYHQVAKAVRQHGTPLFVQLFHGGREVIASAPRPEIVSSAARPSQRFQTEPRALRTDEVEQIIAAYGRCAALAAEAELDGIEVTAAHGYLAEQFFTAEWNGRDDRYGEPATFLTEVLSAVRAAAPHLALGVRLSADSAAARAVAPQLAPLVDYIHLAVGNSATVAGCSGIVPPPPAPRNLIANLTAPFRLGVPLLATTRIVDPTDADALIARGDADAVGMTRALITDPDMPRKVRSRAFEQILRCIGCNACIAHYHAETPIRCAQNPRTGRERTLPRPVAAGESRTVVVVGAGPAGLAAAAEASAAGHRTVILEQTENIGGQAWLAGHAPGHRELAHSLTSNYQAMLARPNVDLRLRTCGDVDTIAALKPDLLVVATGALPAPPPRDLQDIAVAQVWDVLAGECPPGRVLIADWGADAIALDCAEMLAAEGREVTLAVAAPVPGQSLHQYARNQYIARLCRAGVTIEPYLELRSAAQGATRFRNIFAPELEATREADVLLLALGRIPNDPLAIALHDGGRAFQTAGDCRSPRSLEEAILEGTMAARSPVHPDAADRAAVSAR